MRKDVFRKEALSISVNRRGVGGEREQNWGGWRGGMGEGLPLRMTPREGYQWQWLTWHHTE